MSGTFSGTVGDSGPAPLEDVRRVEFPLHADTTGELVVMEGQLHVPFRIARVFIVRAAKGAVRGRHAHKRCAQLMTCPHGVVEVICDDGRSQAMHVLDQPSQGLLVPPGIWAEVNYGSNESVLLVLCDRPYESADYIRDYAAFKAYRTALGDVE